MASTELDVAAATVADQVESTPATKKTRAPRELPLLSRADIATRIAAGQQLILRRDVVLNVSAWAAHHPGGELALLHFVGRDAADEIAGYHSDKALAIMDRYAIGRAADYDDELGWLPLNPPFALGLVRHPDGKKFHWKKEGDVRLAAGLNFHESSPGVITLDPKQLELRGPIQDRKKEHQRSKAYHVLKQRITDAGLYNRPGPLCGYGSDLVRWFTLLGAGFYLYFTTNGWIGTCFSALLVGMGMWQLTFVAHDAGHTGITGNWWTDKMLLTTVASWCGGLSGAWWCSEHDVHHLVPNHPEHDPDTQLIPFFAITKDFFDSLWSTFHKRVLEFDFAARHLVPWQHRSYYFILAFGRFNLYVLSYTDVLRRKRHDWRWLYEITGLCFYWCWFGSMLYSLGFFKGVAYLLIVNIAASPMHVQIVLSHFACSTEDLGPTESFPSRQLRTTMDVECGEDIEFIHGGLNMQVTHHLFPRIPRHNLRKASLLVKEYCAEQDIVFQEHTFINGNLKVLATLRDVANQVAFLKKVADKEIAERFA